MIRIAFPKENPMITNWREKLSTLVVAHEFVEDPALEVSTLQEKELTISGEEAIQKFILDLEKDVNDWRTPRCGV